MLRFKFVVDSSEDRCGFVNGDVHIIGDGETLMLNSMVVLAAAHLMHEMQEWHDSKNRVWEFNAVDSREIIDFVRHDNSVNVIELRARGRRIGMDNFRATSTSLFQAAVEFHKEFVVRLDDEDAAKKSFEMALSRFKKFLERLRF